MRKVGWSCWGTERWGDAPTEADVRARGQRPLEPPGIPGRHHRALIAPTSSAVVFTKFVLTTSAEPGTPSVPGCSVQRRTMVGSPSSPRHSARRSPRLGPRTAPRRVVQRLALRPARSRAAGLRNRNSPRGAAAAVSGRERLSEALPVRPAVRTVRDSAGDHTHAGPPAEASWRSAEKRVEGPAAVRLH
jgi:hypothetical protein